MHIIIPINADNFNIEALRKIDSIHGDKNEIHSIFMGLKADTIKSIIHNLGITTYHIISTEYSFPKCLSSSFKFYFNHIKDEDLVCILDLEYIVSLDMIEQQIKKDKINMEKNFAYVDIYKDLSDSPFEISLDNKRISLSIKNRAKILEKSGEYKIIDQLPIFCFKNLKKIMKHLEDGMNNYTRSMIYETGKEIDLKSIKIKDRAGLYIGSDFLPNERKPKIVPPEKIIQRAIHHGIKPNFKPSLYESINEDKKIKIGILFPEMDTGNSEKYFGPESEWLVLIRLLNKTKDTYTYILGNYPWKKDKILNLDNVFIVDEENIEDDREQFINKLISICNITFGSLTGKNNSYIFKSIELKTLTIYYGWYIDDIKKESHLIPIKQIGSKITGSDIYSIIRKNLNI